MKHAVLFVDDEDNVLDGFRRSLRQQPYRLYTARSGEEAMRILKARDMDVIVADERMPGMSGSDLLAWVTKNCPQVMRIMLTGQATTEAAIRAINEGTVYRFCTKPCDTVELAIIIRKAFALKEMLKKNRRMLERSRQQAEKLNHFNRDLKILGRIVSQDLHEQLRKIGQSCRSTEGQYQDLFDPEARKLIDNALDAVAEVQRFVTSLLQQSRDGGAASPSDRSRREQVGQPLP